MKITVDVAYRTARFVLRFTADPAQAEQQLTIAAERGVSADDCAQLRREWDEQRARTVTVWEAS